MHAAHSRHAFTPYHYAPSARTFLSTLPECFLNRAEISLFLSFLDPFLLPIPLAVGQVRWFARARCLGDQIASS